MDHITHDRSPEGTKVAVNFISFSFGIVPDCAPSKPATSVLSTLSGIGVPFFSVYKSPSYHFPIPILSNNVKRCVGPPFNFAPRWLLESDKICCRLQDCDNLHFVFSNLS